MSEGEVIIAIGIAVLAWIVRAEGKAAEKRHAEMRVWIMHQLQELKAHGRLFH